MGFVLGGLCVLGKIRSSVTLEEGKNVFGGLLAGSLVVNLNLQEVKLCTHYILNNHMKLLYY